MTGNKLKKTNNRAFEYFMMVVGNHAGLTLTRPTGTNFSHINAR